MPVCGSASRSYSKLCRRAYRVGRHPTAGEEVYEFSRLDLYGAMVFRSGYKGSHVLSCAILYHTAESAIAGGVQDGLEFIGGWRNCPVEDAAKSYL